MSRLKTFIVIFVLFVFSAAGYGWYLYTKKPPDIRKQAVDIEVTARDLTNDFRQDEMKATSKYVDRVMVVQGIIKEIQFDSLGYATVILNAGDPLSSVVCSLYKDETSAAKKLQKDTMVRIKGKCTGVLMDVILNNCSIVNQKQ